MEPKSFQEILESGNRLFEELEPIYENMAEAAGVKQELNYTKRGVVGILLRNAINTVAETLKTTPEEVKKHFMEGKSIFKERVFKEATTSADVATYDLTYLGLVSVLYPNLIANEIVGVQPMSSSTGLVFYKRLYAESDKAPFTAGQELTGTSGGYGADRVYNEQIGTGDGLATSFNATLAWTPVVPSTVVVQAGTVELVDDGNGNLTGTGGSGTIDYNTGAVAVTFTTAPASGTPILASYRYVQENNQPPRMKLRIEKKPVTAESTEIGFEWTSELADSLMAYHKIAIEDDVASSLMRQIALDIESRIIRDIKKAAVVGGAVNATWSKTPPSGVSYRDYKTELLSLIREAITQIINSLGGSPAGTRPFVIAGADAWAIISDMDSFNTDTQIAPFAGGYESGSLAGNIRAFYTPFLEPNEIIVGLQGSDMMTNGYIYAPYKVEVSPKLNKVTQGQVDPFGFVMGARSLDGFIVVDERFYGRVVVV